MSRSFDAARIIARASEIKNNSHPSPSLGVKITQILKHINPKQTNAFDPKLSNRYSVRADIYNISTQSARNPRLHIGIQAYTAKVPSDFERFVETFVDENRE